MTNIIKPYSVEEEIRRHLWKALKEEERRIEAGAKTAAQVLQEMQAEERARIYTYQQQFGGGGNLPGTNTDNGIPFWRPAPTIIGNPLFESVVAPIKNRLSEEEIVRHHRSCALRKGGKECSC